MYQWLYLSSALFACALVLDWFVGFRKRRLLGNLPSYARIPFVGNIYMFIGNNEYIFKKLEEISEISERHQKPFVVWAGSWNPVIFIQDPEMIRLVTTSFVEKPYFYSFAKLWVGDGLVTASGKIWKRNIKKLAGTFTGTIVDNYQDVFNAQAQKLVDKLKLEVGKDPFDVMQKYLAIFTLESICQTALGVPRISDVIVTQEYYEAINKTLLLLLRRGINLFLHPDFLYKLSPGYKELVKSVGVIHNVSETVMRHRQMERQENKDREIKDAKMDSGKFKSYYDILTDMRKADPTLTEQQIKDEVDTLIIAGQETVATALLYALLMIGCKPHVQKKLHAEIEDIFGDSRRPVEKQDLVRMEYCEALLNECMRLYPPAPGVIRLADYDLNLKSCTIPKGASCLVNIFGAGRSETIWGPDAAEFRPERWLDGTLTNQTCFFAFSYGKRACIGRRYAMGLLKTTLAYSTRELIFRSQADKLRLRIDLALRPASGQLMEVFLRH